MKALTFQTIKCLFVGGVAIVTYVKESKRQTVIKRKEFQKKINKDRRKEIEIERWNSVLQIRRNNYRNRNGQEIQKVTNKNTDRQKDTKKNEFMFACNVTMVD